MKVFLDTSVVLRVLFGESDPLPDWGQRTAVYASSLWRVEALRTVDRARLTGTLDDPQVVALRREIGAVHSSPHVVPLTDSILRHAAESFPTIPGTLDAILLASALAVASAVDAFVTHDAQLGAAAAAMGFEVRDVPASA